VTGPAGTADEDRRLVVNADDLGLSDGVNAGILHAARHGIVTSASLMVRMPAAVAAACTARALPGLSIGLHLDLAEWEHDGQEWRPVYQVVDTDDADAVGAELTRQIERFVSLTGRPPTHLDSHQHVHRVRRCTACCSRRGTGSVCRSAASQELPPTAATSTGRRARASRTGTRSPYRRCAT
jgi:predicted glycoside hydrolase/deacetylase ChbG (UPF0249 family)